MARSPSAVLPFLFGGSTKIDTRKKGTLILTSLLEDLDGLSIPVNLWQFARSGSRKDDG